jgi:O-antigen/teichoic acid export membrane protein
VLSYFSTLWCSFLSINNHVSTWSKILIKSELASLAFIYFLSFVIEDGIILFSIRFILFYSCTIYFSFIVNKTELQYSSITFKGKEESQNGDDLLVFAGANYLTRYVDSILVSFSFSAEILGSYNRAMQISRYPIIALVSSLGQILLPTLRSNSVSPRGMKSWINYFHIYFLLGNVVSLILMYFADAYVLLILGENWKSASSFMIYFFSTLTMQLYLGTTNSLFVHFNALRAYRNLGVISGAISLCLVLAAVSYNDIIYVAHAFVASTTLSFILSLTFFAHSILRVGGIGTVLLLFNASVPVILVLCQ